jgi:hypothetical protein
VMMVMAIMTTMMMRIDDNMLAHELSGNSRD